MFLKIGLPRSHNRTNIRTPWHTSDANGVAKINGHIIVHDFSFNAIENYWQVFVNVSTSHAHNVGTTFI